MEQQPGYPPLAQAYNPPVSQPTTSDPNVQPVYSSAPPVCYPPAVPQPDYAQAPQPGYPTPPQPGYLNAQQRVTYQCHTHQSNYPPPPAAVPAPTPQPNYNAITNPLPVLDVNNNVMFKVKGQIFSLHDRRVLLDSTGKPVATLRQKILTAHSRWLVYRGDSSDSKDLLFTAKTSSIIQLKTKLTVYLANGTSEDFCDFKVEGSWSERSCVIYVGEFNTIAAQMHMKETAQSFFLGKDTFMITIHPNVDYAFFVALIVILDAINTSDDDVEGASELLVDGII